MDPMTARRGERYIIAEREAKLALGMLSTPSI
jgi:hypothetical protein